MKIAKIGRFRPLEEGELREAAYSWAYSISFSDGVGFAFGCDCGGIPGTVPVFSYS